jgi:DNA-binding NtrC family response regulator
LNRCARERTIVFAIEAATALYRHAWPLNVRELERALAAALAIGHDRIELSHLPASVRRAIEIEHSVMAESPCARIVRPSSEDELRAMLAEALARNRGNVAAVARQLDKDRTQIRRWMKRFGLERPSI